MRDRRDRPPIGGVLAPLGRLAETMYCRIIDARNRGFDRGQRVERIQLPVISVGNLSVGGTGKTPIVRWIVRLLLEHEYTPLIAMRGYKARDDGPSDEQSEYLSEFPDVPIVAQADRREGIRRVIQDGKDVSCIVLDDGFQHRFIARDLDIVLLDASRDPFRDRCLPAGWLREPVESLSRSGVIVLTHCELVGDDELGLIEAQCLKLAPGAPVVRARHAWDSIEIAGAVHPLDWLSDKSVIAACGIGQPAPFLAEARSRCGRVVREIVRPDHHDWNTSDERAIRQGLAEQAVQIVLTTAKDASKLGPLCDTIRVPMAVARLTMRFEKGDAELRNRILGSVGEHHRIFDPRGELTS